MFIKKPIPKSQSRLGAVGFGWRPAGFTLPELILALSIFVIAFNLFGPRLAWFYRRRQQEEQASRLAQTIRLAQALSLAAVQDQAYGVYFDGQNRQYAIYQGPAYSSRLAVWGAVETLKYFSTATSSFAAGDIHFLKNSLAPSQAGQISLSASGWQKQIYINDLGLVEVK